MKKLTILSVLYIVLAAAGCSTMLPGGEPAVTVPLSPEKAGTDESELPRVPSLSEVITTLDIMNRDFQQIPRDIDNREWLMSYVNYLAGTDLFILEALHRNLTSLWLGDSEKREFFQFFINPEWPADPENTEPGYLQNLRLEGFGELSYLSRQSLLLKDLPWMQRRIFDERSEFSYWYLMYQYRTIDERWVDREILPAMLILIPEDAVTPVTYLWLKRPSSLSEMDREILQNGYPWNILLHIMRLSREILIETDRLFEKDAARPGMYNEGVLL